MTVLEFRTLYRVHVCDRFRFISDRQSGRTI